MFRHCFWRFRNFLLYTAVIFFFLLLLFFTSEAIAAARSAFDLCVRSVIPSLFPFFVFSSLFISLGIAEQLQRPLRRFMLPLFGVGGAGASALILGLIGGYPVGVRTTAALFRRKACSRKEAERLLAFCNNSGPGFILGIVGAGIFGSPIAGAYLYLIHTLSALLVGIFLNRFSKVKPTSSLCFSKPCTANPISAFIEAVTSSFSAVLGICGFVIFFSVLLQLLEVGHILPLFSQCAALFGIDKSCSTALFSGILELTNGCARLTEIASGGTAFILAAFLLGFGGFSVHCQSLMLLSGSGLSARPYFLGKSLQAIVSGALATLLIVFLA